MIIIIFLSSLYPILNLRIHGQVSIPARPKKRLKHPRSVLKESWKKTNLGRSLPHLFGAQNLHYVVTVFFVFVVICVVSACVILIDSWRVQQHLRRWCLEVMLAIEIGAAAMSHETRGLKHLWKILSARKMPRFSPRVFSKKHQSSNEKSTAQKGRFFSSWPSEIPVAPVAEWPGKLCPHRFRAPVSLDVTYPWRRQSLATKVLVMMRRWPKVYLSPWVSG